MLFVRSFREADCDTVHCVVDANFREKLAVSEQAAQKFDVERLHLSQLHELQFREQYEIKISKGLAALKNLSDNEDINRAWENIKRMKTSAKLNICVYELKQQKTTVL